MDMTGLATRMRNEFLDDGRATTDSQNRWPLAQLYSALISSERELCRRLHLLYDATTPAICQITIAKVGLVYPRSYAISDKILRIERLRYPGVSKPLPFKSIMQLDNEDPEWDDKTGTPTAYTVDYSMGLITFNRIPLLDGTVNMAVKRLALTDQVAANLLPNTSPEIKQYDDELIHGALKYAYLKDDLQTFDPVRSKVWSEVFEKDIKQIAQDKAALNPQDYVMRPEAF